MQSHQLRDLSLDAELAALSGKLVEQVALPSCAQRVLPVYARQVSHASVNQRQYGNADILVKAAQDIEQDFFRVEALYVASERLFNLAEG